MIPGNHIPLSGRSLKECLEQSGLGQVHYIERNQGVAQDNVKFAQENARKVKETG